MHTGKYNYNTAATAFFILACLTIPATLVAIIFRGNVMANVVVSLISYITYIYCMVVFQDVAQKKFGERFNLTYIKILIYSSVLGIVLSPFHSGEPEIRGLADIIALLIGLIAGITSLLFGVHILDLKNQLAEKDLSIWKTYAILNICVGAMTCSIILIFIVPLAVIPLYIVSGLILKRESHQSYEGDSYGGSDDEQSVDI